MRPVADRVHLDLELACIVGILPRERVQPQSLSISLLLGLDLNQCGTTGDLTTSADYATVDAQVRYLCTEGHFRLIEVLATAMMRLLLAPPGPGEHRAPLDWAGVQIRKPHVMPAAVPAVSIRRSADWVQTANPLVLADVEEVLARRIELASKELLDGDGIALKLGIKPEVVQLPFIASEPATLIEVVRHRGSPNSYDTLAAS